MLYSSSGTYFQRLADTGAYFLCDDCEARSLLVCVTCEKSFEQPTWFYGTDPGAYSRGELEDGS